MKTGLITSETYQDHDTGPGHPEQIARVTVINELFKKINEQNKSIILISTDTDELLKLSDKISVIHRGKLSKIMNAEDVTSEKLGILMGGGN